MSHQIIQGDSLATLRAMESDSIDCCVTSPPYWGLRDYGVEGQIGLEKTPEEYVAKMVAVFAEVRRVLKPEGTCWVNLGDSYNSAASGQNGTYGTLGGGVPCAGNGTTAGRRPLLFGLKPKDLVGIPWRVAFALRADGWYLRQDIIWHKPNPMPESVRDRCTKAHEYIFLLTKSARYFWDAEAMKEAAVASDIGSMDGGAQRLPDGTNANDGRNFRMGASGNKERKPASARGVPIDTNGKSNGAVAGSVPWEGFTRNRRSVWTLATMPTPEAHFATYPIELPELCIRAGCPEGGLVLDPFSGAGTTGLACLKNGRQYVGLELNPEYVEMSRKRAARLFPLFAEAV